MPLLAAYVIIRPRWLIQKSNYIAKKKSFITVKTLVFIIFVETALLFLWKNLQWWEKVTTLFTKVFLSAQLVNQWVFTILYLFRLESHMECLEKKLSSTDVICICGKWQAGFPVIKNNAISNCYDIKASHSEQANGRFYTHLSIGVGTRNDSQRRFFCATQHHNTVLRYCFEWLQLCSNIATLCWAQNRRGESSRVTSPLGVLGVYQSVVSLIKTFHGAWLRVVCIASAKVLLSH